MCPQVVVPRAACHFAKNAKVCAPQSCRRGRGPEPPLAVRYYGTRGCAYLNAIDWCTACIHSAQRRGGEDPMVAREADGGRDGGLSKASRLRAHYELEKRLAAKLRSASREERRVLFSSAYEEVARFLGSTTDSGELPESRRRRVGYQMRLVGRFLKPDSNFCEIGPGDCAMVIEVAQHVRHAYAVDIERAKSKCVQGPSNYSLAISDGTSVPLPPNSIDVVYSDQVMEHVHPDDAIDELKNIYAALKPGGVYICATPNRLSGPHDVSRYFDKVATGFHLKEYTVGELVSVFRKVGFARFRVYLGVRGRYIGIPVFPIRCLEGLLAVLPLQLRRPVARFAWITRLLGIQLVAWKPAEN